MFTSRSTETTVFPTAGVVGGGLAGCLTALSLARAGTKVTLFDCGVELGQQSCMYAGAGMLAPILELEKAEPIIAELGLHSMQLWPQLLAALPKIVFFRNNGTLVVAHQRDMLDLEALQRRISRKLSSLQVSCDDLCQSCDRQALSEYEPALADRFEQGLFFPNEGQLDARQLLTAFVLALSQAGVTFQLKATATRVEPGLVEVGKQQHRFELVVDTRGLGAAHAIPNLRGVRGELLHIAAPHIHLTRPVRLIHPRYPLYIAPREEGVFLVGATMIESNDMEPMTVRSCLELLSACYSLHPEFAEGRILEQATHCRPAFPDNLPCIRYREGLLEINGLYRHGFLIAPALVEAALTLITNSHQDRALRYPELMEVAQYAFPDR